MPEQDLIIDNTETAWKGRFSVDLVTFRQRRFDGMFGEARTWELWRRGRASAVLPYDPVTDQVVLIEQFRIAAHAAGFDPVMVEIPAGLCEPGEDAGETILREAQEEAGLDIKTLHLIGDFLLSPGGCDERIAIFAGRVAAPAADAAGLVGHAGLLAEHEDIRIRVWPAQAAIDAALAGQMPNSVTTIALLWLASRRDWLRGEWSGTA